MSNIDWTRVITPEDKAQIAFEARHAEACSECGRRIKEVCNEHAQINLASNAAAGMLSPEQMITYQSGLTWVVDMRAAWRPLAASGADIHDDANWPAVPVGVAELAREF